MASCDTTVLTGQEGLIQFKPLGTTNCVDDYCPFAGDRIYLSCAAEYNIGDCIVFDAVNIPDGEGQSADGSTVVVDGDTFWVTDTGKGIAGDEDACGNSMEGVPYIEVSMTEGGSNVTWDNTLAGEPVAEGVASGALTVATAGDGYNGGVAGTLTNVDLINSAPTRAGMKARADVVVGAAGAITAATIIAGGSGYAVGDTVYLALDNGGGTVAELKVAAVEEVRGNSDRGSYTLRLCDFQTVCGVRSFSIDLSRDELDVTTLPCSISETCGPELASFRKTQAGFATATGTLEVYFSCDQTSTANKLLTGSLQKTQGGATVRLYVCTKTNADGTINETDSLYIEADIQLLGLSFSVDPDNPTTATINFGITQVNSAFGLQGN